MGERYYVDTWFSQEANPSRRLWSIRDRCVKNERGRDAYVGAEYDREAPAKKLCDRMNRDHRKLEDFRIANAPLAVDGLER